MAVRNGCSTNRAEAMCVDRITERNFMDASDIRHKLLTISFAPTFGHT